VEWRSVVVRALLAPLTVTAGLVLAMLPTPPPAHAEEPVPLVRITLKSMTPALPTRDGKITVIGTVENITNERIFRAQVYFWRNQAPITDREGFEQALASESNDPIGRRNIFVYQNLYEENDPYLEPGETDTFTLTTPVEQLELSPTDGVYLMGVHVLQNNVVRAIGRARLFVPMVSTKPAETLKMTSLVTFSSRPSLVRPGVLSDDHLALEVAPAGRLRKLLTAADTATTSFAVDPALVEELQTMAAGYQVLDGDGGTRTGAGAADAARWLAGFTALQSRRDGYRLLYGSPDLAALVHDGQQAPIRATAAAARRVEATRTLPLLVLPTGGRADAATVEAASALQPRAIALSDRSAAGPGPLLAGPGQAPIVSVSTAVSGGGPGPDPRDTAVQLRQRLLAETWIEASTSSDGATRGRVRLITNGAQAAQTGIDAAWLQRSPLSALLDSTPATWSQQYHYPVAVRETELTGGQLRTLRRFSATQRTYTDVLVDRQAANASSDAAVARAASGAWRRQNRARQAFLTPQQADLDAILRHGVEIRSQPRVSTIDQQGVVFPITIKNTLPAGSSPEVNAVRLRLVFTSGISDRLTIKPIDIERIPAQGSVTRNAEVTARANGIVPVTAQLETPSGRKVGQPFHLEVQVTQNGTTGWLIALAAGLVLFGTTALRIRTVAREKAEQAALDAEATTVLTSAPPAEADVTTVLTSAPPADQPTDPAELAGTRGGAPPYPPDPGHG
jgi:hypothetical protein